MSKSQSALMFGRVKASKEANAQRLRDEQARRLECPIEQAKTYLRQRGFHVFKENVLTEKWSCQRIIVGGTSYEPEEVVAMAERLKERARAA